MIKSTRRNFLKATGAIGAGYFVSASPRRVQASRWLNENIQFGCVGVMGKGDSDSADAGRLGKVVAICDIDESYLEKKSASFPEAAQFFDYREMFSVAGDKIDAVTVSTPDHTHAVVAARAMLMGKHCFCQKPLTHSIEEARILGTIAREKGVVTQMGNQGTASSNLRMCAALVKAGIVGTVKELHVWTNRPVWPQSSGLKLKEGPEPGNAEDAAAWEKLVKSIHWDLWLGPAAARPFSPEIHPFKWRGLWAYGTGALGDMACHTFNMPFMALDLRDPVSVISENSPHDGVFYPEKSKIEFQFPERNGRAALKVVWYDGKNLPDATLTDGFPMEMRGGKEFVYESGCLFVGEKGRFFAVKDYAEITKDSGVISDETDGKFVNVMKFRKDAEFESSPGHFEEFIEGIRGNGTPVSNFPDYAGPLSETILLGNLAVFSGQKIEWDATNMVAANASSDVQRMIRHEYPEDFNLGYELATSTR